MPRPPRRIVPDLPLHVTQRGVDRCPTFLTDEDFAFYLWALREASQGAGCAVHAYVLMTNHVHILLTPGDAQGPVRMMRSIGRRYVRYFNDRYRRTGTLWEGRYRAAHVDSASYLFACSRYIELNPVRARLVTDPIDYAWSSFRHNARGGRDPVVTPHPLFLALGTNREARHGAYTALFTEQLASSVGASIRAELRVRPTLGPSAYQEAVLAAYGPGALGHHHAFGPMDGRLPGGLPASSR